jgi:hypothetical protein
MKKKIQNSLRTIDLKWNDPERKNILLHLKNVQKSSKKHVLFSFFNVKFTIWYTKKNQKAKNRHKICFGQKQKHMSYNID